MRVLFVLSQRPELTGSGVTLDALVREARDDGHDVAVLCGVPVGEPVPPVGGIDARDLYTVTFGDGGDLPFAVPGMSDVMPYPSTVWSTMSGAQLHAYRAVWADRLHDVVARVRPDVVHLNHLWIVSALAADVLPPIPTVVHGHATGLRQMELCPALRGDVVAGLRRHRDFVVLHDEHAARTAAALDVEPNRVHVVGAGYRDVVFHPRGTATDDARRGRVLFVGKFAAAKGLPWLLDACEHAWGVGEDFVLEIAGDGSGVEADELRARMRSMAPRVVVHGRLDPPALAERMRASAVVVLPSMYEGLPLVLAEARACGCALVATDLPGVVEVLAPAFADALHLVPTPRRIGPDRLDPRDADRFVADLVISLRDARARGPSAPARGELAALTWRAVYDRVRSVWEGDAG